MIDLLNDEQRAFQRAVRDFCADRVTVGMLHRDDEDLRAHDPELYAELADLGWIGVAIPEEYGGAGGGMTEACVFLEETTYGLAPIGGYNTGLIVAGPYKRFATEEQKREVLANLAAGGLAAIAMSEPGAGSDVAAVSCRAVAQDDGSFLVNGQKTWISNAHLADHILLVARTDTGRGRHGGLTMFQVPAGAEGLETRRISTMAGREVNDVFLTDCRLPAEAVVGRRDEAWSQLMSGLNSERLIVSAMMLGRARRALDDTIAYVSERRQFGRPIGTFQVLRHRIADLATEIECCRHLVYRLAAATDADPGRMLPREASMTKLKTTETAKRVALEGMQMMGGYGFATEYGMERQVRETVASTVYAGSSEIMREVIASTYGLREERTAPWPRAGSAAMATGDPPSLPAASGPRRA